MFFVLVGGTIPWSLSKLTKLKKCYLFANDLSMCAFVCVVQRRVTYVLEKEVGKQAFDMKGVTISKRAHCSTLNKCRLDVMRVILFTSFGNCKTRISVTRWYHSSRAFYLVRTYGAELFSK